MNKLRTPFDAAQIVRVAVAALVVSRPSAASRSIITRITSNASWPPPTL